jgi:predicted acetyltransferase
MLELRELTDKDEAAFFEGLKEADGEDLSWYSFSWKPGMPYQDMMKILKNEAAGIDLEPGRVPHSMLYAFLNGKIIGRVSVRHELNDHLRKRGGNIGYWVAKNYRKLGYATEMLRRGLEFCKLKNISPIMISCADDNVYSWKIIERYGAKLEDKVWDDEGKKLIRRYWLNLGSR